MMQGYGRIAPYFGMKAGLAGPELDNATTPETLAFIEQVQNQQKAQADAQRTGGGGKFWSQLGRAVQTGIGLAQDLGIELGPPAPGSPTSRGGGSAPSGGGAGPSHRPFGGSGAAFKGNQRPANMSPAQANQALDAATKKKSKLKWWLIGGGLVLAVGVAAAGGTKLLKRRK